MSAAAEKSATVARLKTLTNQELKDICRAEFLAVSGVKAVLQQRLINLIDQVITDNNQLRFDRIRQRVLNRGAAVPQSHPSSGYASASPATSYNHVPSSSPSIPQGQSIHRPYGRPGLPPPPGQRGGTSHTPSHLSFKHSPFYEILEPLSPVHDLVESPQSRQGVTYKLSLSESVAGRFRAEDDLEIMLYCTAASIMPEYERCDITFPSQFELRVNGDEVKWNHKGLKNKPGTTKAAPLTAYIRKSAGYSNVLQFNYALTSKRYSWVINLVRRTSVEKLTGKIRAGRAITKEQVVREMVSRANDPDIIATSTIMSLKDPISTMRISLPCRSVICSHIQCFDVSSYLQLQEQAPTWSCPICSKTIHFDVLAVDHYFKDILEKTSKSVDQVTIEPDGAWKEIKTDDHTATHNGTQPRATYDEDSDDDLVEIDDPKGGVRIKKDPTRGATPGVAQHTPPLSSRETSAPQTSTTRPNGAGQKRASAVIDLTLSDQDDDPPRAPKRPAYNYSTPASMPDARFSNVQQRPFAQSPAQPTLPSIHSPSPVEGSAQHAPPTTTDNSRFGLTWAQNYAAYGSPWRVQQQSHFSGGSGPR